jgi:hypothetical protein
MFLLVLKELPRSPGVVTVELPPVPSPVPKQQEQQQVQQHIPGRLRSVSIRGAERSSTTFMVISSVFMMYKIYVIRPTLYWLFGYLQD